ncbi:ABC1-domain-containing protein [Epithele typhae]|uniref:ABC1-domain-containing protein n=1 Tax=Epithele typhae TaxID=378194 RepID=UPI0020072FD4|nr:ABC1-domain-containing protein [Epithele typhae]KAH9944240.1 ABC1-domain-containing protein [Epithele typhae]
MTAQRFVYLCCIFIPVLLAAPMLLVGPPEPSLRGDRWGAVWWYGFLTSQMQRAGPTFTKLAQWAASRADLFPALLCDRMGALHSRGKAHSLAHTRRVIEGVLGMPLEEVFEEFDETPIGTGAIAQVYRGTLKKDIIPPAHLAPRRSRRKAVLPPLTEGPPPSAPTSSVAIKVLHPRVAKMINRDLSIMSFFANCLNILPTMQWLSLPEEVNVFGEMMHEQLDLRKEADNLAIFEHNFDGRKLPLWSSQDLLVEEFENALPLELFLKNGGGPYNDTLAEVGLDAFLNMLLLDNFVHSDLHPGNIMIKFMRRQTSRETGFLWDDRNPSEVNDVVVNHLRAISGDPVRWRAALEDMHADGYIPEVVFVDAGLVTTLNAVNRRNFLDLFRAVAEFDGYRAGLVIDVETFALRMQHIVLNVKRKTFSLGQIKISDILKDVLHAVRKHHVKMEGDFVNTVISILLLEGIGDSWTLSWTCSSGRCPFCVNWADKSLGWMEARELATAALVNADDLVKYDWLTPAI